MYFIYQKQINVASEYSYNVDSIVKIISIKMIL